MRLRAAVAANAIQLRRIPLHPALAVLRRNAEAAERLHGAEHLQMALAADPARGEACAAGDDLAQRGVLKFAQGAPVRFHEADRTGQLRIRDGAGARGAGHAIRLLKTKGLGW